MKLKDRLNISSKQNNNIKIQNNNIDNDINIDINEIFLRNYDNEKIISELIKNNLNILIVSQVSFNKKIISEYIKQLIYYEDINTVQNITNLDYSENKVNIIEETSIADTVKILELIMYGYKSFIFQINMNSFDNIIEKLKASIAVNFINMTNENISTLLKSSNLIIIDLEKNNSGFIYPTKICKIKEDGNIGILADFTKQEKKQDSIDQSNGQQETEENKSVINEATKNININTNEEIFDNIGISHQQEIENSIETDIIQTEDNVDNITIENQEINKSIIENVQPQIEKNITEFDNILTEQLENIEGPISEVKIDLQEIEPFDISSDIKINKLKALKEKIKQQKENSI